MPASAPSVASRGRRSTGSSTSNGSTFGPAPQHFDLIAPKQLAKSPIVIACSYSIRTSGDARTLSSVCGSVPTVPFSHAFYGMSHQTTDFGTQYGAIRSSFAAGGYGSSVKPSEQGFSDKPGFQPLIGPARGSRRVLGRMRVHYPPVKPIWRNACFCYMGLIGLSLLVGIARLVK